MMRSRIVGPYDEKRHSLIDALRAKGITHVDVLSAMDIVPREQFVQPAMLSRAYEDTALPIDDRQTISQPYTVAFMTQALDPRPGMKRLPSRRSCAIGLSRRQHRTTPQALHAST
jgi:hypothetical protein